MRISSFRQLFCCILISVSSADWQLPEVERNITKPQNKMMTMNEKLAYVIKEINKLKKNNSQDRITAQFSAKMEQSTDEIKNIKKDNAVQDQLIKQLLMELKQTIYDMNEMKRENALQDQLMLKQSSDELKDMRKENAVQDQLIKQLTIELKQSRDEINTMKKELCENNRRDEVMEKSVSLTQPQLYRHFSDEYFKRKPDFSWTINDLRHKMLQDNFTLLSDAFPLKAYAFRARLKFEYARGKRTYVSLSYTAEVNERGPGVANLTQLPAVYFTCKDQLRSSNVIRHDNSPTALQYDVFYYDNWVIAAGHNASDTVSIDVHVEPPGVAQQAYSSDGSLTYAVRDFNRKRWLARDNAVWYQLSPYFYTGPKGYKVQVYVRTNGYWEHWAIGLTVSVHFLAGPYDDGLSKAYPHRTTVTLLHPTDPAKHVIKSVEQNIDKQRMYNMHMGTHDAIDALLHMDTLFYQVAIVPI